jgi:Na+/phosphate symporter
MVEELEVRERFNPVFAKLLDMLGTARDAFNRHSAASLEQLKRTYGEFSEEIKRSIEDFGGLAAKASESQKAIYIRFQSILTHLQMVGDNLEELSIPIVKKMKEAVLFSDKAVAQTNQLFDNLTGILRSILDAIKTGNDFLKRYIQEEGQRVTQSCNDFATEHEARLIEGLCLPQAAPLFLSMLNRMRAAGQHTVNIGRILSQI